MIRTNIWQKIFLVLFGIIASILFLEFVLRLAGFFILHRQETTHQEYRVGKNVIRVLCLGESTTMGAGVGREDSYPRKLEIALNELQAGDEYVVINKGLCGITTDVIVSTLEENLERYRPDIVVTMMGINDWADTTVRYDECALLVSFKKLKVYKLAHFLCRHMWAKMREIKTYDATLGHPGHLIYAGQYDRAAGVLEEIIASNPMNDKAYVMLGKLFDQKRVSDQSTYSVEELFARALEINPQNKEAYYHLVSYYAGLNDVKMVQKVLPKSLSLTFDGYEWVLAYVVRWDLEFNNGVLSRSLILKNWNVSKQDYYFDLLAHVYAHEGKPLVKGICNAFAKQWRAERYFPDTQGNYCKLRAAVLSFGAKLVCVQYPMRDLDDLRRLVDACENVTFVDNEGSFKKGVQEDGFAEFFIDIFAGDFGHCTPKGYELLAKNVAHAILAQAS